MRAIARLRGIETKRRASDAAAVLPANYKFTATDAGLHNFTSTTGGTVTLKTPGSQSVTATDTVTASITGSQTGIQVIRIDLEHLFTGT